MKNAGDSPSQKLEEEKSYLIGYTHPKGSFHYAELGRGRSKGVGCGSDVTDAHCAY